MERRKSFAARIGIWILSIAGILAVIIGGAAWYLSRNWKPLLDKQLKELVISASDSLYHVEYSYFNISMVTGNATIKDFKLIPDTNVYRKLQIAGKAPDNLYDLKVANVVLRNFHPGRLYSDKKLNINAIVIDNPILVITNRRQAYNDTIPSSDPKSLYKVISKFFKEIRVDKINLSDIDFTFINRSNRLVKQTAIKNLNVNISDVLIDSLSKDDPNHYYYARQVGVEIHDYEIATPDSLYYLKFKKFEFSSADRTLLLNNISLEPRYKISEFHKKLGYAKDRFNIDFQKISINNIDIRRFVRDQKLYAGKMSFGKALVEVYNNNSYPHRRSDRTGQFPHQQLQNLALDLKIDTLKFENANISYSEFDKNSGKTGKISFDHTEGNFFNLTNDSSAISKNNIMRAELTSKVMNAGSLNLNFTFDLADKLGGFTYNGILGPVNGKILNNITQPLGMISVKSASIKKLQFNVKANQDLARGSMQFMYDNLNVQILKRDEESGALKKQGFVSGLANAFVVHQSNPNKKGELTPGTIYYRRPITQSFFSFLWQSLFTGIKESVGVDKKKETKIRNTVNKVSNFFETLKENGEEHRRQRLEKREDRKKEKALK